MAMLSSLTRSPGLGTRGFFLPLFILKGKMSSFLETPSLSGASPPGGPAGGSPVLCTFPDEDTTARPSPSDRDRDRAASLPSAPQLERDWSGAPAGPRGSARGRVCPVL